MKIAHLSDLHFGRSDPRAVAALESHLSKIDADLVVVTGDLTQSGRRAEYRQAAAFLQRLPGRRIVVPGNHDAPVFNLALRFGAPWSRFRRHVDAQVDPVLEMEGLIAVGMNSARRAAMSANWSYGRLSTSQIRRAAQRLARADDDKFKIVAVHHPFVKGPGRAGAKTVGRASQALTALGAAGVDAVLTGHVHASNVGLYAAGEANLVLVQAGTAVSTRTRLEAPSFNEILVDGPRLEVRVQRLTSRGFEAHGTAAFSKDGRTWRDAGLSGPAPADCAERRPPARLGCA